ncbi:hypothetical protein GS432_20415 [Rhodococcus hoagii]|nr:hypothetical protein [Prescottella equi]
MTAGIVFATDSSTPGRLRGFADRLLRILQAVTASADTAVGDIELLEPAEHAVLAPVRGLPAIEPRTLPNLLVGRGRDRIRGGPRSGSRAPTSTYGELDRYPTNWPAH